MLCCMCLLETPKMLDIFDNKMKHLKLREIIEKHFWFKANPDEPLTSHICTLCWHKIEAFHEFYESVDKAHKIFQQNKCKATDIKEELISVKEESDPDEPAFLDKTKQIDIKNYKTRKSKLRENIEKNPLENEQLESEDNEDDQFKNECSTSSDEYEFLENNDDSDDLSLENLRNFNKKKKTKNNGEACSEKDYIAPKKKRISHRLDPILTEQLIKKHIPMLCDLCVYTGNTFSDIIGHFKEHHSEEQPYIMCCNRKFTRSYCIDQHAIIHENPNSFRCNECNKSFTTTYGLQTHNLNHHAPEEKRIHACEFCPRRFGRRQLLEVHRQSHIPKEEWTITCTKCTTRTVKFVSQYLLNIHNSMFHKREANICHVCAKEIKDKKAFEKHVRAHFEDSGPRVKCSHPNCGRWLKDEDNLKTHMQLHNLAGKKYNCSECNKECPNRRALTNHRRYVHANPTFRCEECDKTFKKAISLREHMTQHTGETLYSCPFCTRTFNSNANMHAHKKKQHPVEWKELRRKNIGPLPD